MIICIYCISHILIVSTILISVQAKSTYDSESKFRDDSEAKLYPVKRKTPNYEQAYYVIAHEEQPDMEYSDNLNNLEGSSAQHYRRVDEPEGLVTNNLQPVKEYNGQPSMLYEKQLDLRRQVMQNGLKNRRTDRVAKRESNALPFQSDDAYGMVYRKGRLVGILEPYPQAYELAPLSNTREGIEEIQPLPMTAPNARQQLDNRYSTNKLSTNKQLSSDTDWAKADNGQDSAKFTDEKYPMILTDFKIDSKLSGNSNSYKRDNLQRSVLTGSDKSGNEKSSSVFTNSPYHKDGGELQFEGSSGVSKTKLSTDVKRNAPSLTDEKITELKSALDRIQNRDSSDKVEEIEEDLRGILNDMGLIENEGKASEFSKNKRSATQDITDKREIDKEDENLEQGANKIEIVKASHNSQTIGREKRDDNNKETQDSEIKLDEKAADQEQADNSDTVESDESKVAQDSSESSVKAESDVEQQNKGDAEVLGNDQENSEIKRGASKVNIANYQGEGEAYIRSKRQESSTDNDLMKGLEKSGDLTVSGNKSPLASSGNGPEAAEKHTDHCSSTTIGNSQKSELSSDNKYETDVERNLQAKIDAIKEEVKREIAALQPKNSVAAKYSQESQRKKRDAATTLLEEETSAVDPQEHPEEKLMPYIRRRRNLESLQELKRTKRGLPDFSNLKNIDTNDYLELNDDTKGQADGETLTDYQLDSQENKFLPQNAESLDDNSNTDNSKEKRNTVEQEDTPDGDTSDVSGNSNEDSVNSSDNTAKVSERNVDDSSSSPAPSENSALVSTISNESEDKQVDLVKREDNNNDAAATGNNPDNNANLQSSPEITVVEDQVQLHQQDGATNENLNLAQNQEDNSQNLQEHNMEKRDPVSSKNLIDLVVDQNYNEQLKKLNENSRNNEQAPDISNKKEEVQLNNGNLKNMEPEVVKPSVEITNSEKTDMTRNSQSPHVPAEQAKKRTIKNSAVKNSNKNLEIKVADAVSHDNEQKLKKPEPSRRRRQVEEENQNKPQIFYRRRKRANAVMLDGNVAYLPYRPDEEEVDDEGDEFDDDGFDDRTASMQKRDTSYNNQVRRFADYDNSQEYEVPDSYNNYLPDNKNSLSKRYVAKLNSDLYDNPGYAGNYLYQPNAYVRRKRQDFDQLVGLHGGGPMLHHLAAVRERNVQHVDDNKSKPQYKRSRTGNNQDNNKEEAQNIADLSDVDLFGALPQSYEGELSRFKRVKRAVANVKKKV